VTTTTVEVRLFASLREAMGAERIAVEVPADADVAALRRVLTERNPELAGALQLCRVAVDQEMAHEDAPIAGAAEIALIPPVSGG
jgi:molybdopterin converting factor subunit 1